MKLSTRFTRSRLAVAGVALTAASAACGGTALAGASTAPAVTGTENFQIMTTSGTSRTLSIIATGVFTAGGTDAQGAKGVATETFPGGTFQIKHSKGTGTQSLNPKTCLLKVNQHGTYTVMNGTGKYAGITGSGTYKISILAIGAKVGGKCSQSAPPVAWQQVINASGPVTLK